MMPNGCRRSPSGRDDAVGGAPVRLERVDEVAPWILGDGGGEVEWDAARRRPGLERHLLGIGRIGDAPPVALKREQPALPAAVRAAGDADAAWHGDAGVGQEADQVLRVADLEAAVRQMRPSLRARGVRSGLGTARAVEAPRRVVEDGIAAGDEGNVVVAVLVGAGG